ncbi:MAG TPA: hypothetical protein VL588_00600, partial [Bdellovibrionota bacterium]|nr:hypothetical protein [Bdellovibrionota bacterium]
ARLGGMNVAMELRTPPGATAPARFSSNAHIPAELRGQPMDGWWLKISRPGTSDWMLSRDEIAFREAREAFKGTGIDVIETRSTRLPDGTRAVFQRRAPGKNVTEVVQDLFGDAMGSEPTREASESLIQHLLEPQYAPCFSGKGTDYLCGELLDHGIDLGKAGAKLQDPSVRSLLGRLRTLRNVNETSPALAGTRQAMDGRLVGNKLFWMEGRGLVTGLDLSVDNFTVEMVGGEARIHIFDL